MSAAPQPASPAVWEFSGEAPTEPGWYAIVYCWELEEGSWTGVARWNGRWLKDLPITGYAGPFADQQAAQAWGGRARGILTALASRRMMAGPASQPKRTAMRRD